MIKLSKIMLMTLLLISQSAMAQTENANASMTKNRVSRGINSVNDVVNIDGPFYAAEVTVYPYRYSNPNLPSDPVVMDCHGEIIKINPGNAARCEDMEEGRRATVRISAADFKLGADIRVLVAR